MAKVQIAVKLVGMRNILFDRYSGKKTDELEPLDKLYLAADGKTVILPALNIMSFLSAINTVSAPQRVIGKAWKSVAAAALSYVDIEPFDIPFTANGKSVLKDSDQISIVDGVARLPKGIPNEKSRPMLAKPWELSFTLSLFSNNILTENMLKRLFVEGGEQIGLGTFRGVYGKFIVDKWEKVNSLEK